jgi:trimethylamine--corrinoid protein Co-methyltransferase
VTLTGPKGGQLELFTRDQIRDFHLATLNVLEDVGIAVHDRNAATILADAGAEFDEKTGVVRLPQGMVDDAIRRVPKSVTLGGRTRERDLRLWGKMSTLARAAVLSMYWISTDNAGRRI